MNIDEIKNMIKDNLGKEVMIKENIGRNRFEKNYGTLLSAYPALFTLKCNTETKSFSYADILTGIIKIKLI